MASIRQSTATRGNSDFKNASRRASGGKSKVLAQEGNLSWLRAQTGLHPNKTYVILLGGCRPAHVRIRTAQAVLRHDMTPSHWSHVILCTDPALAEGKEIAVAPPLYWKFPPMSNGVIDVKLTRSDYDDPAEFPNVAMIAVPVGPEFVDKAAEGFKKARHDGLDAVEMMLRWLGYLWGVAGANNPLDEGVGLPGAAMIDYLLGAASFDLTPAINSRASCPEAIWQSARWWNEYHKAQVGEGQSPGQGLAGGYLIRHRIVPE